MTAARCYVRLNDAREHLPGLGDGDEIDITTFSASPLRFAPEGNGKTDDFLLAIETWELLGRPERISVTVSAA